MEITLARAIALYLPQFHPIPENDAWWGKGFTEWTNVAKAKSLFRGHYQPHIPSDLGFYDLRVEETRIHQAEIAELYGIEAFCYYHYWFAGRRILNRPFDEVVATKKPSLSFCLCWANETWSGVWHGAPKQVLIEQTYPGLEDHQAHFRTLFPAFNDKRYLRVDGKPVFLVYKPLAIPDLQNTLDLWRDMAARAGLGGMYIIGVSLDSDEIGNLTAFGYDAVTRTPAFARRPWATWRENPALWLRYKIAHKRGIPTVYEFSDFAERHKPEKIVDYESYPTVVHAWDNTPRSGINGVAYRNPDPKIFRSLLNSALDSVIDKPFDRRLIFLKSWNEWAEGNHLEPDLKFGKSYLEVVSDVIQPGRNKL